MSSGNKVKGLLKGLRYISQIFDSEKEQEIQIGYPTDVKHVAHIGWDGPSVNSPSWMNEFKSSPGFASAPLSVNGDVQNKGQENSVKWVSEDSRRKSTRGEGQTRDLPEMPKASRRQLTSNMADSPTREKSDKSRQSKRASNKNLQPKNSLDGPKSTQQLISTDSLQDGSSARNLPDIPKKSRRKKSKESSAGGSKIKSKGQFPDPNYDSGSPSEFVSKSSNQQSSFGENESYEREMNRLT